MVDETWSAEVSSEFKEEISELVKESGLSSKEFLEQLISSYKIELLQGNSDASKIESDCHKDKLDLETLMAEIYARNKELEGQLASKIESDCFMEVMLHDQNNII